MSIFVVIPAYNEEETIYQVIKEVIIEFSNVIVVNDCSIDKTENLALKAGAEVINLKKNYGYDFAIEQGIKYALEKGASTIITLDADGQHPVGDLKKMVNILEQGQYQIVIGIRDNLPRFSERVFSFLTRLFFGVEDITCGMKCYSSEICRRYGFGSTHNSIGTFLTIKVLKSKGKFKKYKIPTKKRINNSRFGMNIKTELKIYNALLKSIFY
tara:strand:+ start:414 stop:1052 length:639 start_codon:yes stop_codon:yes gene_type:complete